jgi:hypothetical protein
MEGTAAPEDPGGRLGRWVIGPLLALLLVLVLIFQLPGGNCEPGTSASSPQRTILLIVAGLASLGTIAAGLRHWVPLARRNGLWILAGIVLIGLLALGLLLSFHTHDNGATFGAIFLGGVALTFLDLLVLLVAWATGRRVADVGALLPLYLVGVGVFFYPLIAILVLVGTSGALC